MSETEQPSLAHEKWRPWQWAVVGALGLGVAAALVVLVLRWDGYIKQQSQPVQDPMNRLEQKILGYRKQIAITKGGNFLTLGLLADAYMEKARITGDAGWLLLAEQSAKASLAQASKKNARAYLVLARLAMATHHFGEALRLSDKALADPAGQLDTLGVRFDAHLAIGELTAAGEDLKQMGQARQNEAALRRLRGLSVLPDEETDGITLARTALLNQATGKTRDADQYFRQALSKLARASSDSRAWTYTLYALFQLQQGQVAPARENLRWALNTEPGYLPALTAQIEVLRHEGQWEELLQAAQPIIAEQPRSDLLLRLAEAARNLGLAQEAQQWLAQAEAQLQKEADFGHRRDYVRLLLLKGAAADLEQASLLMHQELKLRHDLDTLLVAAELAIVQQNWSQADQWLKQARATGAQDSRLDYWQGRLATGRGQLEQARQFYAQALQRDPHFDPVGAAIARQALGPS